MRRLLALPLLALPSTARACAVCGVGLGPNRATFFWTTVLLSLLPLGMFAAGALLLRRQLRRAERAAEAPAAPGAEAADQSPRTGARTVSAPARSKRSVSATVSPAASGLTRP